MNTLYLIRHGETDWNKAGRLQGLEDIALNEAGQEQAHKCGLFLEQEHFDVIVSSPLKRALKTASIIGQYVGIHDIQVVEELHERDFGQASGLTRQQKEERFPDDNVPGIEPWESLRNRVMAGMMKIVNSYANKRIIVVAHGGVINAILHTVSNGEIGTGVTKLNNTCLNILHFEDDQWEIEKYNCIEHL